MVKGREVKCDQREGGGYVKRNKGRREIEKRGKRYTLSGEVEVENR